MNKSRKKITVAYGVVTNASDFEIATTTFSPAFERHFDEVFIEEITINEVRPRFLSTVSRLICKRKIATLAIPDVSRRLFSNHFALSKLQILAQRFRVDVIFIDKPNSEKCGGSQKRTS